MRTEPELSGAARAALRTFAEALAEASGDPLHQDWHREIPPGFFEMDPDHVFCQVWASAHM